MVRCPSTQASRRMHSSSFLRFGRAWLAMGLLVLASGAAGPARAVASEVELYPSGEAAPHAALRRLSRRRTGEGRTQARYRRGRARGGQGRPGGPARPGCDEPAGARPARRGGRRADAAQSAPARRCPDHALARLDRPGCEGGGRGTTWRPADDHALVVHPAPSAGRPGRPQAGLGTQSDRPLHPRPPRAGRAVPFTPGRSRHLAAPGEPRPDRTAAIARRRRGVPRRPLARPL